jgi:hypothetical protein
VSSGVGYRRGSTLGTGGADEVRCRPSVLTGRSINQHGECSLQFAVQMDFMRKWAPASLVTPRYSSSHAASPFQFVDLGEYPLHPYHKDMIEAIFASLDLLHDAIIRSLPHPLRALGRHSVWPIVVRAELAMQAS